MYFEVLSLSVLREGAKLSAVLLSLTVTRPPSTIQERKFNVIIYGLYEWELGKARSLRYCHDLKNIVSVFSDLTVH